MNSIKVAGLTIVAAVLVFFLFNLGPYAVWWNERIVNMYDQKEEMSDYTSDSIRMEIRYPELSFYKGIKKYIAEQGDAKPILLLPPKGLLQKENIQLPIAEPVVFYHFTGLKSYWANMPKATESTWALVVQGGQFNVVKLTPSLRDSLITEFKKYEISL